MQEYKIQFDIIFKRNEMQFLHEIWTTKLEQKQILWKNYEVFVYGLRKKN